ncbi:SDR family oxidoreductase [Vibrio sp. SCSIO 43136]|uniref:SDR family oxidoreductase n=1 Tax=Vibrio sp. SCSIO 43136 TaxID=2819101 RepID=UPI002076655A|nr:SDR family oxidoreductase [Vibrio sp. SCSIO 43136]USD67324.1 SDR family oxidoreductase [Vibrio sp. SCSIO 43136]
MDILVIGGNGGIGLAMVKALAQRFPQANVHATYRRHQPQWTSEWVIWHRLDVTDEHHIAQLSRALNQLDWLINCVGMLHTSECGPEKNIAAIDEDFFLQNIATNTLPSMLLAKHFSPLLKASSMAKFVTISAKVGSIEDNRLGGWYSYRMSKAALNMFLKTLAIEWQRTIKQGAVLALHPGTTNTALSKPFQSNVPTGSLFHPDKVADDLIGLIEGATPADSGAFWAYDGQRLPW